MHIMTREIQTNQELEDNTPSGERSGQETQQAGCSASVSDHVQDGAELSRLVEFPGCHSVQGVQEAGYTV